MTIKEWEENIEFTTTSGLEQVQSALQTLTNWTPFNLAFKGYGVERIRLMVSLELERRRTALEAFRAGCAGEEVQRWLEEVAK